MKNKRNLLFIIIFLFITFFSAFSTITDDEGIPLNGANLILEGKSLYKDLVKIEGPFTFYINLPILKFLPQNLLFPRVYTAFFIFLGLCFLYLISEEILNKKYLLLFLIYFTLSMLITTLIIPSHKWYSFFLNIIAVFFIVKFLKENRNYCLFLSGIFTGLNFLTMPNNGIFLFIGFFVFFIVKYKKQFLNPVKLYLYGILLTILIWFIYSAKKGILDDYFYSFYVYILKGNYTRAQWNYNNDWFNYLKSFTDFFYNLFRFKIGYVYRNFIIFFLNFMPPFIYLLSFLYIKNERNYVFHLFLFTGVFQYISMLIQGPAIMRGMNNIPFSFILFFYFLRKLYVSKSNLILKLLSMFLFLYIPLKFTTHLLWILKTKSSFLNMKRAYVFVSPDERKGFFEMKRFIDKNIRGKDNVFFLDNGTIFYFIFNKEIPVNYDFIEPYYLPLEEEMNIVNTLKNKKIRYVIHTVSISYPKNWKGDYIYEFIINNYKKIKEIDFGRGKISEVYVLKEHF